MDKFAACIAMVECWADMSAARALVAASSWDTWNVHVLSVAMMSLPLMRTAPPAGGVMSSVLLLATSMMASEAQPDRARRDSSNIKSIFGFEGTVCTVV